MDHLKCIYCDIVQSLQLHCGFINEVQPVLVLSTVSFKYDFLMLQYDIINHERK